MLDLEHHDKWLKKYKFKLIYAWRSGCDDRTAAEHCGMPYSEYEMHMEYDDHMSRLRDQYVDALRKIARENIAKKIQDGDRQTCEWYLEKTDPMFGGKAKFSDIEDDDFLARNRADIQKDLEKFMAKMKGHKFDGNK